MSYRVDILPSAEKELDKLSSTVHVRISNKILALEDNPRPVGIKKLKGNVRYRLRVGNHRVLYEIDDKSKVVKIVSIGHRREVYR